MAKFWLPQAAAETYFKNRMRGDDPFPDPQTNREEVVHQLWQCGVMVAGWWLEDTEYLKDLLDKYLETQPQEAIKMHQEALERAERRAKGPTDKQISERLRDIRDFAVAKSEGRKRLYSGSGTEHLGG